MNVMAEAHKQARELLVARPNIAYRVALILALINAHKAYKAECANSPVTWFTVEGYVVCPDTGVQIPFSEGTSKASIASANVLWYIQNFDKHFIRVVATRENGSVFVERPTSNYK